MTFLLVKGFYEIQHFLRMAVCLEAAPFMTKYAILSKTRVLRPMPVLMKLLMKQLAIPLGHQKTVTKRLVMSPVEGLRAPDKVKVWPPVAGKGKSTMSFLGIKAFV